MRLEKVISGAQTGGDRGGLKAAIAVGISIGGWCPKNRRAEDGRIPDIYPLQETPSSDYPQRTEWNARDSDATVVFGWGVPLGRGSKLMVSLCEKYRKPVCVIDAQKLTEEEAADRIVEFINDTDPKVLNIAGSRESKAFGIEAKVERVILRVFALLGNSAE